MDPNDPKIKALIENAVKEAGKLALLGKAKMASDKIRSIRKNYNPKFSSADANAILAKNNLLDQAMALTNALEETGLEEIHHNALDSIEKAGGTEPNKAIPEQGEIKVPTEDQIAESGKGEENDTEVSPREAAGTTIEADNGAKKGGTSDFSEPSKNPDESDFINEDAESLASASAEEAGHPEGRNMDGLFRPTKDSFVEHEADEGVSGGDSGPRVNITGPSSIYLNQEVQYKAETENFAEQEDYIWQTEGQVNGIESSEGNEPAPLLALRTGEKCGKGVISILAKGAKSGGFGQINVYVNNSDNNKPTVQIDGPNTLNAGGTITLSAKTENFNEEETYFWSKEGRVGGVSFALSSPGPGGSSSGYKITASEKCGKGAITVMAKGAKSDGRSGIFNIYVINKKKEEPKEEPAEEKPEDASDETPAETPETAAESPEEAKADETTQAENKSRLKKLGEKAGELLKKSKAKLGKVFNKALLKSPWFWIGVLIFLVGIGLFAWLFSLAQSGANGKTATVPVDVVSNKTALEKLNVLAGNGQEQIADEVIQQAQENLLAVKEETTDPESITLIDETLTLIDQYFSTHLAETGLQIIDNIKKLLAKLGNFVPKIQGRYPINPADILGFNNNLHLGTPLRPEPLSFDKGHGTYIYTGENKCDAVDLFTKAETSVYPAMTGTVVDVSDDGTGNNKLVIKNGDYEILYANFSATATVGQVITDLNQPIGKTVKSGDYFELHLEFSYCGACLVTTSLDKISHDKNSMAWGEYLWSHIKEALTLE